MPWIVFFVDFDTSEPPERRIGNVVDIDSALKYVFHEMFDFVLQDPHVGFENVAGLARHRKVLVKVEECFMVKVSLSSVPNLMIEFVAAILADTIAAVGDSLSEPLAVETDCHPHVDVIRISGSAGLGSCIATEEGWIVPEDAQLNRFFSNFELPILFVTDSANVGM